MHPLDRMIEQLNNPYYKTQKIYRSHSFTKNKDGNTILRIDVQEGKTFFNYYTVLLDAPIAQQKKDPSLVFYAFEDIHKILETQNLPQEIEDLKPILQKQADELKRDTIVVKIQRPQFFYARLYNRQPALTRYWYMQKAEAKPEHWYLDLKEWLKLFRDHFGDKKVYIPEFVDQDWDFSCREVLHDSCYDSMKNKDIFKKIRSEGVAENEIVFFGNDATYVNGREWTDDFPTKSSGSYVILTHKANSEKRGITD